MMYESHGGTRKALYRSRDGMILGVCKGLAGYSGIAVFFVRTMAVLAMFFGWFFPVILLYFVAALLMKPEPVMPIDNDDDREFYDSYTSSRTMALQRLKRVFDSLDRRVQRMEDAVTTREYDWERRLHQ
jgi:phage shock protein C